jgi:aldose 1-epimerase
MRSYSILLLLISTGCPSLRAEPTFTAEKATVSGVEIVRLCDARHAVEVSILPSIGNRAYELKVHGKNLLYFLGDIQTFENSGGHSFSGIPFLAPWGNRIAGAGFWANGKRYLFNPDLGNLNMDSQGIAIHGLLTASSLWEITDIGSDAKSAHLTSKLEFWRHPDLMANWPFAEEYQMTYTLTASGLKVTTVVRNLSAEPMPLVIGYHPYFNIPDVPRVQWTADIPARKHVETDSNLLATGALNDNRLPNPVSLKDHNFDDGYTDLVRDSSGYATLSVAAGDKKIEEVYGPKYTVALVFSPPGQNFICFEPMTTITNGINLAHEGKYKDLQSVAPGAVWQESFWIRFSGF